MPDGTLKASIIDASPTDAQTLSYLLSKRLQTRVEIANDGLEGLDKLATGHFDLAFLDIQVPVMNGVEVLREIRASPNTAELPVIVISSNSDAQTVRSLLKLKIFDYVVISVQAQRVVPRFCFPSFRLKMVTFGRVTQPKGHFPIPWVSRYLLKTRLAWPI